MKNIDINKLFIVSPDEGARSRAKFLADIFNQYIIETECDDSRKIRDEVILNAIEVINKNISNKTIECINFLIPNS